MSIETLAPSVPVVPIQPIVGPKDVFHEFSPMRKAVLVDWNWLDEEFEAGRLGHVMDRWVAVLDRRIVDTSTDGLELPTKVANEYNVHPNRVVLVYVAPDQLIG